MIGGPTHALVRPTANEDLSASYKVFEETLAERGYVVGQNLSIAYRTSEGHDDRLPSLLDELLRLKVDILLTLGTPQLSNTCGTVVGSEVRAPTITCSG